MINLVLGSSWRPPILCLTRILKPTGEPGRFQGFVGENTSILLDPRSMAFQISIRILNPDSDPGSIKLASKSGVWSEFELFDPVRSTVFADKIIFTQSQNRIAKTTIFQAKPRAKNVAGSGLFWKDGSGRKWPFNEILRGKKLNFLLLELNFLQLYGTGTVEHSILSLQCCGSETIYSGSGSSFEFSEFRIQIQAKVPDPCGS